jgi:diaminobutyrate-2-oxoglutarate transaminase
MSLVLMKPEHDIWKPGAHSGTFRGNNLAFVTAAQALDSYWTNGELADDTVRKERLVRDWLENIVHSYPMADFSVRGRGLIQGLVTSGADDMANQIAQRAFAHGVVIETSGAKDEVLKVLPALTIEDEQLMRGLEVIERSVAEVLASKKAGARVLKFGGSKR